VPGVQAAGRSVRVLSGDRLTTGDGRRLA
jgi:hypothetical protein